MKISIHEEVSTYYGQTLQTSKDLKTNACCTNVEYPKHIKNILSEIHDEVVIKYYGCGLTIPYQIEGLNVLDLGSGSGRDCYILSKLVGKNGLVTGVDMTDEQLDVANRHLEYHSEKFGYKNVRFLKGNIERLEDLDIGIESLDLIVSNCVINLAEDKKAVLQGAYKALKPGGELYFSDVYSDRRIPVALIEDPVLYGECLSGALYWNDFLDIAKEVGFKDPRSVESEVISIENDELIEKVGNINFYSVTYRLFKLQNLENDCEDYGQAVSYKGSVPESKDKFILDDHHIFEKGRIQLVCGNTFMMLKDTRFAQHFDFYGDFSTHYGIFEGCGGSAPFSTENNLLENSTGITCC